MADPRTQVRVTTTTSQADALDRVARARGMSKAGLIREAFEAVTGVAADMAYLRQQYPHNGFESFNRMRRAAIAARNSEARRKEPPCAPASSTPTTGRR